MIIAIDGPSGSGKSTVSKLVAQKLGLVYIDTGAIYRTLALVAGRKDISFDDAESLCKLSEGLKISFKFIDGLNHVFYASEDVTEAIRTPGVSMHASKVSSFPQVRKALLSLQRDMGHSGDSILEGRDIGTVIFPDADFKFFLIADNNVRAERRMKELHARGIESTFEEVKEKIQIRDMQDSSRDTAPLAKAEDAVEVDTSGMSIDEVVELIISHVNK